eukprot:2455616-Amphidinium_carterae.1
MVALYSSKTSTSSRTTKRTSTRTTTRSSTWISTSSRTGIIFWLRRCLLSTTLLDSTSVSTTTLSTSTRCSSDINMLTTPKQQHKRVLPSTFEGNKQDHTFGPITTFKNWAAKTVTKVGNEYIDYQLKEQGLSHEDADKIRERQRLLQQNAALLRVYYKEMRNDEYEKKKENVELNKTKHYQVNTSYSNEMNH